MLDDIRREAPEDFIVITSIASLRVFFYDGPGVILPSGRRVTGDVMRALVAEAGYDPLARGGDRSNPDSPIYWGKDVDPTAPRWVDPDPPGRSRPTLSGQDRIRRELHGEKPPPQAAGLPTTRCASPRATRTHAVTSPGPTSMTGSAASRSWSNSRKKHARRYLTRVYHE
jgi:hypothetical protein